MAEHDKWVRKVIKVLMDMGFKDVSSKRGKHRKFRYEGDDVEKPCTIVIQSKMKEYARFHALAEIKDNLLKAGATETLISQFDDIALGMMITDKDDTLDDLEEKLQAAIKLNERISIAQAAFELGKHVGVNNLLPYSSSAIQNALEQRNEANIKRILNDKIELILTHLFRAALKAHLDRHDYFDFYTQSYGGQVDKFDNDISKHFGFRITGHDHNDTELELTGFFDGELKQYFDDTGVHASFRAIFSDGSGEGDQCYTDTDDFYHIRLSIGSLSVDRHKRLADDLNNFVTLCLLGWKNDDE